MNGKKTNIQKFFTSSVIFVTGGTGLLGNILVEKLLRSCPDIKKIYILVRAKWAKDIQTRFEELLNTPIYDGFKKSNPEILKKLHPLSGDLESSKLGLSSDDLEILMNEVNCVFHVGATVRFTEELGTAIKINISGTNELIEIARRIKDLKSFVHVSTMYAHCQRNIVDEEMYGFTELSENLIKLESVFENEKLNKMTPTILGKWPNTYTYTKAATEDLLGRTATDLPIAIVRPSLVLPAFKEPIPGWTVYGHSISMFISAYNLGIAHVLNVYPDNVVDMVPADYVINNLIAAAWSIGTSWRNTKSIEIYNCISSQQNPVNWKDAEKMTKKHDLALPSKEKIWHRFVIMSVNKTIRSLIFWLKLPLAYFSDAYNLAIGKPQTVVKMYKKIHYFIRIVSFFSQRQWIFNNKNNQELWNKLQENDKELFNFDMNTINWDTMFLNSIIGIRQYIFKEPLDTLPHAKRKMHKLKIAHYSTVFIFLSLIFYLLSMIFQFF